MTMRVTVCRSINDVIITYKIIHTTLSYIYVFIYGYKDVVMCCGLMGALMPISYCLYVVSTLIDRQLKLKIARLPWHGLTTFFKCFLVIKEELC